MPPCQHGWMLSHRAARALYFPPVLSAAGTYQLLKVSVLPCTVLLSALQGTRLTRAGIGAALLVTAGTAIATVTDFSLTWVGAAVGLVAVVATAQSQISQGVIQTEQKVGGTTALYAISLPQALLTLAASLLFETSWVRLFAGHSGATSASAVVEALRARRGLPIAADASSPIAADAYAAPPVTWEQDIWTHPYSGREVAYILLTCACAVMLNYSCIALIGRISAIAFQFVNQTKTVLVMLVGFLVFAEDASATRVLSVVLGLACVVSGVIWYTIARQRRLA